LSNFNKLYKVLAPESLEELSMRSLILILASCFTCVTTLANPLEEIVVTASRSEQRVGDLSTNISTIDNDILESVSHRHINEVMQRISGTWISRGNGQEHLTAIRSPVLTGAGGCGAFLMTQDGISLRAAGFCNVNQLFESHSEVAERIEVIKGPGSASHGSNAMHGLINIITPTIASPGTNMQFEAGSYEYYRLKLDHSVENWRVDFSGTSEGGYKDDSGFDQQKLTTRYEGSLGGFDATTSFSYANLNQETAGFVQGHDAYKDAGLKRDNPNPEAYRDARSARLYSRLEKQLDNGQTLSITPYFRYVDMTFLQHFLPGEPQEKNGHTSAGVQVNLFGDDKWILGLDGEATDGFLKEHQAEPITGNPFLAATIPEDDHYDYEVDARVLAVFGQYKVELSENTDIIFGARYEWLSYDYDNQMIDGRTKDDGTPCGFGGCRFNRPADRDDSFTNFSPKLGLVHRFSDSRQLYAQLASGFRAPEATELYRLQAGQSVNNIDSEEIESIELGFRGSSNNLSYDLSVYTMRKDNFIFRDADRNTVDNGETSHRGVELTLQWQVSPTLSSNVFFSYARHEYENNPALTRDDISGNDIDTAPKTMGSVNLAWQPRQSLRAELEWVHLGEYYTNPQNTTKYEGHDLLNLRLSADISEDWNAFIRIMNLNDTDYAERADFAFGNERYFVGEPISVYLGIRLSL
jgi:iron complex outermembrane recepter protein